MRGRTLSVLAVYLATWQAPSRAAEPLPADDAAPHYRKSFALLVKFSDGDKKLLDEYRTAPLDERVTDLLKHGEPILESLHRGAALKNCKWGYDYAKDGFDRVGREMVSARQMASLACLRARQSFERGQGKAAVDDLCAVVVLGRHFGTDAIYIAKLVQWAIEGTAIDSCATHLLALDAGSLKALSRLDTLPPSRLLSESVLKEKEWLLKWVRPQAEKLETEDAVRRFIGSYIDTEVERIMKATGGTREGLLRLIDSQGRLYDELAKAVALPRDQVDPALAAFRMTHETTHVYATDMLSTLENMRYAEARVTVRWAMLRVAIASARGEKDALKTVKDPSSGEPFEYSELKEGGFELKSKFQPAKRPPIILQVPKQKQ